jgi:transketolase C-terminal domain/subunit
MAKDLFFIAVGSVVVPACKAAELLQGKGSMRVVNARFIKPLDAY